MLLEDFKLLESNTKGIKKIKLINSAVSSEEHFFSLEKSEDSRAHKVNDKRDEKFNDIVDNPKQTVYDTKGDLTDRTIDLSENITEGWSFRELNDFNRFSVAPSGVAGVNDC